MYLKALSTASSVFIGNYGDTMFCLFVLAVFLLFLFFPNSAASKLLDMMYQTRTKHSKCFKHITANTLLAHFATCKRTMMCLLTHLSILDRREPIWMPLVHSAWSNPHVKELAMFFPSTSKAARWVQAVTKESKLILEYCTCSLRSEDFDHCTRFLKWTLVRSTCQSITQLLPFRVRFSLCLASSSVSPAVLSQFFKLASLHALFGWQEHISLVAPRR